MVFATAIVRTARDCFHHKPNDTHPRAQFSDLNRQETNAQQLAEFFAFIFAILETLILGQ